MKFAEHLGAHLTPEWRSQYVQYDEMKKFIYSAAEKAPESNEINDEILRLHFAKFDGGFFQFCDKELKKVNTFFAEKLAEAIRRFSELEMEIANTGVERLREVAKNSILYSESDDVTGKEKVILLSQKNRNSRVNKKKLSNMKFAVGEFYLSLVLIQNFQKLNFTAFRKILKKHDKVFRTTTGVEYRNARVQTADFNTNKDIDELITNTETIAIEDLEHGNRSKAMKRLRVPPLAEKQKMKPAFFWGLFMGMWLVLFVVIFVVLYAKDTHIPTYCSNNKNNFIDKNINKNHNYSNNNRNASSNPSNGNISQHSWAPAIRMYRGCLIIIVMIGLLGVNVQGWGNAGVNHVLIFELDPRHHLLATEFLMISSFFGVLWALSCLGFLLGGDIFPVYSQPVAFVSFLVLFFFNPTKTFWYRSRRWLLNVLFRILCAPFYPVKFADFWLADQLNSLVVSLRDIEYLICFYSYDLYQGDEPCNCANPRINFMRPIIALLPAWFRFAQCLRRYYDTRKAFPHLVNAGKYFASIMVTIFSTFASVYEEKGNFEGPVTIIWILCLIFSTLFSLSWDLFMDWGLFARNAGENVFLREQIVYNYKAYYYLAMISDVFLRILKPLTVSVVNSSFINHEFFVLFLGTSEVIRRFIWNYFRLENEHLNNIGEFRAVRDISIKPMIEKEQVMQSGENGIYGRLSTIKRKMSSFTVI